MLETTKRIGGRILTARALGGGGGYSRGLRFARSRSDGTDRGCLSLSLAGSPDLFRRFLHLSGLHGSSLDPPPENAVGFLSLFNDEWVLLGMGLTMCV